MIVNWTVVGPDGITAYNRVRSKPFKTRLLRFGETCSYKIRAQEPLSSSGDGRQWHEGIFIGVDERRVIYARPILRKPNPLKLNKDDLAKVAVTP